MWTPPLHLKTVSCLLVVDHRYVDIVHFNKQTNLKTSYPADHPGAIDPFHIRQTCHCAKKIQLQFCVFFLDRFVYVTNFYIVLLSINAKS